MSDLLNSAKLLVYVNARLYGSVFSWDFSSQTPKVEARGLDVDTPIELMPGGTACEVKLAVFRPVLSSPEAIGMLAPIGSIIKEKYFSLTVLDRTTDQQIFRADRCSVASQSWSVSPKSFLIGNLDIRCLSWNGEVAPL